jgi:hypothetical protein
VDLADLPDIRVGDWVRAYSAVGVVLWIDEGDPDQPYQCAQLITMQQKFTRPWWPRAEETSLYEPTEDELCLWMLSELSR